MKYYVYILYSSDLDQFYVGSTQDVVTRLEQHRSGRSKSTSKTRDWKLCFTQEFSNRADAVRREREIKKKKSRKYIEYLIAG